MNFPFDLSERPRESEKVPKGCEPPDPPVPPQKAPSAGTRKMDTWDVQRPVTARSRKGIAENKRIDLRAQALEADIHTVKEQIVKKFGQSLCHRELLTICMFVSQELNDPIDRDASRRTRALFAWCAERLDTFLKVLYHVQGESDTPASDARRGKR